MSLSFLRTSIQADTLVLFAMLGCGIGLGVWTGTRKIVQDKDLRIRKDLGIPPQDRWAQSLGLNSH